MDNEIIVNIVTLMKEKHISQRQLSDMTGIPKSTIGDNLANNSKLSAINLYKIAEALGVSVEYIRFGYEPRKNDNKLSKIVEQLNEEGNIKLLDYAEDLLANSKYRK